MIQSSDRELAELRFGSGHGQKKTTKNNNKSRAEQEPRSAHGRAVKNTFPVCGDVFANHEL